MTSNDQMALLHNIANNLPAQEKLARAKARKVARPPTAKEVTFGKNAPSSVGYSF